MAVAVLASVWKLRQEVATGAITLPEKPRD